MPSERFQSICRWGIAGLLLCSVSAALAWDRPQPLGRKASGGQRISHLIEILKVSSTGKRLIDKSLKYWNYSHSEQLVQRIRWGKVSRTDAVLTRHYDPKSGEEQREREVTIYLNQNGDWEEWLLDLAHELVHATQNPQWDPYDPHLNAKKYIQVNLESAGGELDAFFLECQVALELSDYIQEAGKRCVPYQVTRGNGRKEVSREKIQKAFYQVGKWKNDLLQYFGEKSAIKGFPFLSGKKPVLYSSTGQAPYPIALIREYEALTESACRNSRMRLEALSSTEGQSSMQKTHELLQARCHNRILAKTP